MVTRIRNKKELRPFLDLTGRRFGRLVVLELRKAQRSSPNPKGNWICKCDCGNEVVVQNSKILEGSVKSCGCLYREKNGGNWMKPTRNLAEPKTKRPPDALDYLFGRVPTQNEPEK